MPSSHPDSPASPNFRAQQSPQPLRQLPAKACEASPELEQAVCDVGTAAAYGAAAATATAAAESGRQKDDGAAVAGATACFNPSLPAPPLHAYDSLTLAQSNSNRQQQLQAQHQQQLEQLLALQQQYQQQQPAAVSVGQAMPLLAAAAAAAAAAPVATLPYMQWGHAVLPAVDAPAAPAGGGGAGARPAGGTSTLPGVLTPEAGGVALSPFSPMAMGTPHAAAVAPAGAAGAAGVAASPFAAAQAPSTHMHVNVQGQGQNPGQQVLAELGHAGAMAVSQVLDMQQRLLQQVSVAQLQQPLLYVQPTQQQQQQQSIPFPQLAHQLGPSTLLPQPQQLQLQPQQLHPQPPAATGAAAPPATSMPAGALALAAAAAPAAAADADAAAAAQCRLAAVLRAGGKPAEAVALLDVVLAQQPARVEALFQRAACQQALGQVHEVRCGAG